MGRNILYLNAATQSGIKPGRSFLWLAFFSEKEHTEYKSNDKNIASSWCLDTERKRNMSKTINTIDIVGLGALGVMYADFFTKALGKENVRILADINRMERYKKEQITFNGEACDFQYSDAAKESRPSELMLFAVKYGALETAMEENAHLIGENTILLSVLNGIRSEEDLGRRFGGDKVVHCIAQKMEAKKEGNAAV